MSSDLAVRAAGVGKMYRIGQREREVTLAEQALRRLRHPLGRDTTRPYWALQDVDLDVPAGEVFGLIGRNGAGKSTLLKVLSRITPPTAGRVELNGRVGSLLEVGTGFHPELTGRENIYLNGAILGMRRGEIDRQFDAIVDFAGVATYLETPVKRYSSGMYVRLAFAVAAHLETEILLVDEVLAVGDQEFQDRCLGKMGEVSAQGRTVIVVSHNLDTVIRLCKHAAVLDHGRVAMVGPVDAAVHSYVELMSRPSPNDAPSERRGSGEYRVREVTVQGGPFTSDAAKRFSITVDRVAGNLDRFYVAAHIVDDFRRIVAQCDSRFSGSWATGGPESARFDLDLRSPWLKPGSYDIDVFVCTGAGTTDVFEGAARFDVLPGLPYRGSGSDDGLANNLTLPDFEFRLGTDDEGSR
jgi:lipopolysaccharide transport system ATP-binding protein